MYADNVVKLKIPVMSDPKIPGKYYSFFAFSNIAISFTICFIHSRETVIDSQMISFIMPFFVNFEHVRNTWNPYLWRLLML